MNILRRDNGDIKKTQVSPLEKKMALSRIKNTVDGIGNWLDQEEKKWV